MELGNCTFLITGGASGLGAATARHFVAQGAHVILADLAVDAGSALAAELGAAAHFVRCNVSDVEDAQRAVEAAHEMKSTNGFRGLINCAGVGTAEKTLGRNGPHDFAHFERVIRINLIGSFNMIRLAAQAMATLPTLGEGERGVMINTASVAAYDGQIGQAAYSASKAGIVGMTLPIARDLAREGIRVMTIAPGIFETPMLMGMPQEVRDSLGAQVPFPSRLGRPHEYALLAEQIVRNPMLNGETIRLDGAIRMGPR
jgi:NAD(P)-dependent dehydrogenase (short-subunit alcohol dehydrogenase family)